MAKKNSLNKKSAPPESSQKGSVSDTFRGKKESQKNTNKISVPFYKDKFIIIIAVISIVRLWLTSDVKLIAIPSTTDDFHYTLLAHYIKLGRWLGPLDQLTLHTRTFFPLYLSYLSDLKISMLFASHLLYVLALVFAFFTLRKVISNDWILLAGFVFVAFNPMFYAGDMNRVVREGMWVPLAIFIVFAYVRGLLLCENYYWKYLYAILCGLALGAFYLTREDGIMIFPVVGLLLLSAIVLKFESIKSKILINASIFILPFIIWKALVIWNININEKKYHAGFLNEGDMPSYVEFYKNLGSIQQEVEIKGIPYSKDTRMKLFEFIPTFGLLKPYENIFLGWSEGNGPNKGELLHFVHAVKWALNAAGYYESYKKVDAFYTSANTELLKAFEEGHFKKKQANPQDGSGYLNYLKKLNLGTMAYGLNFSLELNDFKQFDTHEFGSVTYGGSQAIDIFNEVTHDILAFTQEEATPEKLEEQANEFKNVLMRINYKLYAGIVKVLFYLSLLCFVIVSYFSIKDKSFKAMVVLLACGALVTIRIFILSVFYETNNLFSVKYLSLVYPFLFLFIFISVGQAINFFIANRKRNAKQEIGA